jgi:hypothetical protein
MPRPDLGVIRAAPVSIFDGVIRGSGAVRRRAPVPASTCSGARHGYRIATVNGVPMRL